VNADVCCDVVVKVNTRWRADYAATSGSDARSRRRRRALRGGYRRQDIINYTIDHNLTATATYALNPDLGGSLTIGQNLNTRNQRQLGNVGRTLVAPQPFKASIRSAGIR